ncbi:hypothetical protein LTR09_010153 [Extremus antarcticus]|uniref:Uncharacterized protein n=1 Tax=Extremus antarcticus TaxID=702011 RepID=A0AAJ0DET9_9PEZI|nr:hypothetical protein LTR09_010153 [Extremus antarcticus]
MGFCSALAGHNSIHFGAQSFELGSGHPYVEGEERALYSVRSDGLKELTIVLAEADFNGKHDKYPWVDVLDDEELKALPITAQLSKLRGLRQFALEPRPHCFTDFIRQKAEKAIQEEYKGVRVVDQERSPGSEGPISYGGCERA